MTFRKFRKKYKILKINVVKINSTIETEFYDQGQGVGVCVNLKTDKEFKFEMFCKFSDNEIFGDWKKGDAGQVKIIRT